MTVNNTSLITPTFLKYCLYPEDIVEIESHKKRCAGENLDASEATKFYPVWEVKVARLTATNCRIPRQPRYLKTVHSWLHLKTSMGFMHENLEPSRSHCLLQV